MCGGLISFINVYVSVKNLIAFPCLIFFQADAGPTSAVKVFAKYGGRGGVGGSLIHFRWAVRGA